MTQTLSVTLPSSTIYVAGTVNGIETVWTNTTGNVWESIADRSANDVYLVELTLVGTTGNTTNVSLTLFYGLLNLITDRTNADVAKVQRYASLGFDSLTEEERAELAAGLKGAYNAADLNRVEAAVNYLAELLRSVPQDLKDYGASIDVAWDAFFDTPYDPDDYILQTHTAWKVTDIPSVAEMQRYLGNVVLLRNALDYATDELPSSMERLNYKGANAIEQALVELDVAIAAFTASTKQWMDNTAAAWHYSGELYTGEV